MKKILILFFVCFLCFSYKVKAEIIANENIITKKFDIWTVSCKDDEMFSSINCRMFVQVTDGTTIFVNPNSNYNRLLIVSNDAFPNTKAYIKVDNSQLVSSESFIQSKYNFVKFTVKQLDFIYNKMRLGKNLYIRFTVKDKLSANGYKEITAKVSLAEFQKAFVFFLNQRNKYDNK